MCSSGCPTPGAHRSWGECVRSKGASVFGLESTGNDFTAIRRFDRENEAFRDAVKEGLNPESVSFAAIDKAKAAADQAGSAVDLSYT